MQQVVGALCDAPARCVRVGVDGHVCGPRLAECGGGGFGRCGGLPVYGRQWQESDGWSWKQLCWCARDLT